MSTSGGLIRSVEDVALFRGLSQDNLNLVLSRSSVQEVAEELFLFRQGEPAREIFLLDAGRVRLQEVDIDGHELLIRFIRPGEVFGDKAATLGEHYGASAVSVTPVRVYTWTTAAIVGLIDELPRLASNLFEISTRYLHYARVRHRMLATSTVERRIHWAVTELARSFGSAQGRNMAITGRTLQKDIADLAVTTTYSVSRVLRSYQERGVLTIKRGQIVLLPAFQQHHPISLNLS
jgi:CRP-like cAMP-binding protein